MRAKEPPKKGVTNEPLCQPNNRTFNTQSNRNEIYVGKMKISNTMSNLRLCASLGWDLGSE